MLYYWLGYGCRWGDIGLYFGVCLFVEVFLSMIIEVVYIKVLLGYEIVFEVVVNKVV